MERMPEMTVTRYAAARDQLWPCNVVFFCPDTSGLKKCTPSGFVSWRIQCDQVPAHECAHVGLLDRVRERVVIVHATSPHVIVQPFSAYLDPDPDASDGKLRSPYPGKVYVGSWRGLNWITAAMCWAWAQIGLDYDYMDLAAIRLGIKRQTLDRLICSEFVAEALRLGIDGENEQALGTPANGWAWTPADLARHPDCRIRYRLK